MSKYKIQKLNRIKEKIKQREKLRLFAQDIMAVHPLDAEKIHAQLAMLKIPQDKIRHFRSCSLFTPCKRCAAAPQPTHPAPQKKSG